MLSLYTYEYNKQKLFTYKPIGVKDISGRYTFRSEWPGLYSDPQVGLRGLDCGCTCGGRHNIKRNHVRIADHITTCDVVVWFCEKCGSANNSSTMILWALAIVSHPLISLGLP